MPSEFCRAVVGQKVGVLGARTSIRGPNIQRGTLLSYFKLHKFSIYIY